MMVMVALVAVVLVGCGGPVDIWQVSVLDKGESCSVGPNQPPDTTARSSSTWEIYKGPDSKYYLWLASSPVSNYGNGDVLEGTKDGKSYTFKGTSKTHSRPWTGSESQVTTNTTVTITIEMSGNSFTGTGKWERDRTCQGNQCSNNNAAHTGKCTTDVELVGIKIDPDLEHRV